MKRCPTCKEYIVGKMKNHLCSPAFKCWCPERGEKEEDSTTVRASGAGEAAEMWAAEDDRRSADYAIIYDGETRVTVKTPEGEIVTFVVCSELSPSYYARRESPDED